MIRLQGVSKTYGPVRALGPIDLDCPSGETTVLIGPSGCGKSTLLRVIVGLVPPDTGSVSVDGVSLAPDNLRRLRLRMGYVIQEGGLFPHLDVRRNVTLAARCQGREPVGLETRIRELADLLRLETGLLDRFPAELSGGQRQRAALMRALMLDPAILLLDEPLGALDPMIRAGLQDELARIFEELDKTVVMVTHDLGEAAHFAATAVLLRDGAIAQQGSVRDLFDRPSSSFVRDFVRAQRGPLAVLQEGSR